MPRWLPAARTSADEVARRPAGAARRGPARSGAPGQVGLGVRARRGRRSSRYSARQASAHVRAQLGVAGGGRVLAEQRGDPRGVPGRPGEERGGDVALVGRDEGREVARVLARHQPLAPVEAGVPEVPLVRPRLRRTAPPGRGGARSTAIRSARSSQRTIAGHSSRRTCGSPYSWYSSHGTSTIASPQPAEPLRVRHEAGRARRPASAPCCRACRRPTGSRRGRAATSAEKPATSYRYAAVGDEQLPVAGPAGALAGGAVGRDVARRCRGSSTPPPRAAG